jgi:hypothetical protein
MGRPAINVKRLARCVMLWQGIVMHKSNESEKAQRLAEALRANLRRRKQSEKDRTAAMAASDKKRPT